MNFCCFFVGSSLKTETNENLLGSLSSPQGLPALKSFTSIFPDFCLGFSWSQTWGQHLLWDLPAERRGAGLGVSPEAPLPWVCWEGPTSSRPQCPQEEDGLRRGGADFVLGVVLLPWDFVLLPLVQDGERVAVWPLLTPLLMLATQTQQMPTAESYPRLL